VCVNKWDINPDIGLRIESKMQDMGAMLLGRIPYDNSITKAQVNGKAVVEFSDGEASESIRKLWNRLNKLLP
jgi:MinD superfamily P-loop ATPase